MWVPTHAVRGMGVWEGVEWRRDRWVAEKTEVRRSPLVKRMLILEEDGREQTTSVRVERRAEPERRRDLAHKHSPFVFIFYPEYVQELKFKSQRFCDKANI